MTLSHIQYHLHISNYLYIGQSAWPIFAYLATIGLDKTRNQLKYILRIALFGLAMQLVLIYLKIDYVNIFITIAAGLLAILGIKYRNILLTAGILIISHQLNFDYKSYGIILMIVVYFSKQNILIFALSLAILNITFIHVLDLFSVYQWWSMLSIPILAIYDGTRGKYSLKYFFYIYYPAHIAIIYFISTLKG